MSEPDDAMVKLEVWKTTIEVQKHFNEIEWKIRGLALTLITAVLGASALGAKDGTILNLRLFHLKLAAAILIVGIVVWFAFYFVDKVWYHRLLIGSVRYGEAVEESMGDAMPGSGLTKTISEASPFPFKWFHLGKQRKIHSDTKLSIYYWVIGALLVLLTIGAQVGVSVAPSRTNEIGTTPHSSTTTSTLKGTSPSTPGT